jgi:integrase
MRGTLVCRNGHYSAVIEDKDPITGKRKQHWITLDGNKQQCQNQLTELVSQKNKGLFVKPGKDTLAEYLVRWLKDCVKPNLAPRTYELYSYMCEKHIIPIIGNIPLNDLKPLHLQSLYSQKIESGLSPRTVQLIHITTHKSLKNALKTGLLNRNVAELVDSPKILRPEMRVMNESDLQIFLAMAQNTEYYPLFYCYTFTGARRSELLSLKWSDVDLILCQLSICHKTKTQTSRRMIALTPSTAIVLREHKEAENKKRQSLGLPAITDNDYIFAHFDGSPLRPDTITHLWEKLAKRCGLQDYRLHDLRHSHASLLLKQGINAKVIQERLGHSNISTTLNIYAHVMPGLQKAAAEKFDSILLPKDNIVI